MIRTVQVIIPARDEQRRLPGCLASVAAARRVLRTSRRDLTVETTVVLDRCVDGSPEVARTAGVTTLTVDHGNVGAARDAGVRAALLRADARGIPPDEVWIACTDADTLVPPHWLVEQVALAGTVDAVVGTVEPLGLADAAVLSAWRARHLLVEGHPHVHGANLGLRGSTYVEVGGFRPMPVDEDVDLVRRIRAGTTRWVATDRVRVASSARRTPRCRGGFADYLGALEVEVLGSRVRTGPHGRRDAG